MSNHLSLVEQEAARLIADRILATVELPSDLALISPARASGLLEMAAPEIQRFITPVRFGHRTIRYRMTDIRNAIEGNLTAPGA